MINDAEIAIVSAASKALELLKKDPYMPIEEIIKIVMLHVNASSNAKIQAIAAVNGVVKIRREDRTMTDRQIVQQAVSDYRLFLKQSAMTPKEE